MQGNLLPDAELIKRAADVRAAQKQFEQFRDMPGMPNMPNMPGMPGEVTARALRTLERSLRASPPWRPRRLEATPRRLEVGI